MDPLLATAVIASYATFSLVLLWWVERNPNCPRCAHCRQEAWNKKQEKQQDDQRKSSQNHINYHRDYGEENCPFCEERTE